MCGFLGAYGPSARSFSPYITEATAAISHRGPDGEGRIEFDGCVLAHQRLAVLDLSGNASQPMSRGHLTLVYNGQIYNHLSLRDTLPAESYCSHGDTETLISGIAQRAEVFLDHCEGMFAGAYFDKSTTELTLFRDPLGIKPLYVAELPDSTWIFGSEVKALLALVPHFLRRVSQSNLSSYLRFENWPQGGSLFEGVRLLPLGAVVRLKTTGERVVSRSLPSLVCSPKGQGQSRASALEVREQVTCSVESHLISDVPIGVYLSGGIDSSVVAAIGSRSTELLGFTGYFETGDAYYDERPVARALAARVGIQLEEVPIRASDFIRDLDKVVYALDEPRMGMGSFSQYVVAQAIAKKRKVVLAGHGGDELFGGYPLFKAAWLLEHGVFSLNGAGLVSKLRKKEIPWVLNFLRSVAIHGRYSFAPHLFSEAVQNGEFRDVFEPESSGGCLTLLRNYYRDTYLPGLLAVEDKISMAHGLETRVPLWSKPLVAWAGALAPHCLMPRGELKGLLRAAFSEVLPKEVLAAPKRGFPTPLRLWFRTELKEFVEERLLESSVELDGVLGRKKREALIRSHHTRPLPFALDERRAHRIWMLLCLESWFRQFKVGWGPGDG